MKPSVRIVINSVSSYILLGFSVVLNLLLVPYAIRYLGKASFGLVALAQSLQFIIGLSGTGVGTALTRYFSFNEAARNEDKLGEYYSSAMGLIFGVLTTVYIAALLAILVFVVPHLEVSGLRTKDLKYLIIMLGFYSLCELWNAPSVALCASRQKFYLQHLSVVIAQLVFAAFILIGLRIKANVVVYGLGYALQGVVSFASLRVISRRLYPDLSFRFANFRKKNCLKIVSISAQVLLPVLGTSLYIHGNQLLVNFFLGPVYNTYLAVCLIWQRLVWRIMASIGTVISPQITVYDATGNLEKIKFAIIRITKYSALIGVPFCCFLGIMAEPIFNVWLGPGYETDIMIMPWFAVALAFYSCQTAPASCLIALGQYALPSVVAIIIPACGLVLAGILMGIFKMGLMVVAITWSVGMVFNYGIFQIWYVARKCNLSLSRYIISSYLMPVLSSAPLALSLFVTHWLIEEWSLNRLALTAAGSGILQLLCYWVIGFDRWDKNFILSLRSSFVSRLQKPNVQEEIDKIGRWY